MNDLQIFQNEEFGTIRGVERDGEPWFVGKDVADALGYSNTRDALRRWVEKEDRADVAIHDGSQNRSMVILNESGLYSLIFSSKLPKAKEFKRWVTSEVLPSLRRNGAYMTPDTLEEAILNPDTLIRLATTLKQEQEARREAEQARIQAEAEKKQLENQAKRDKPYADFGRTVAVSKNALKLEEFAKIVQNTYKGLGRNKLFSILREKHVLYKSGNGNLPLQEYINREYFVVKESPYQRGGEIHTGFTTMITGKGQIFLAKKLAEWLDTA